MIDHRSRLGIFGSPAGRVKIARGLPQRTGREAWKLRPQFVAYTLGTSVKAGETASVPLGGAAIPSHAEIGEIRARLTFNPESTPSSVEQKGVVVKGDETHRVSAELELPGGPANLVVGLEGGDTIWSWAGRPKKGSTTFELPDFADAANAYLEEIALGPEHSGSLVTLRFTLRSDVDGLARLNLADDGLRYRLLQPQGWENDLDDTVHMDRNLTLAFGKVIQLPLDPIVRDARDSVIVEEITVDVSGELGEERLLGDVSPPVTSEFATVGGGFAVAQQFALPAGLAAAECVGVALGATNEDEAEIYIEVRRDRGGTPGEGAPLASGTLELPASDPRGAVSWSTVRFSDSVTLEGRDASWWVVVKEIRGSVRIGLDPALRDDLGALRMNRGGRFWHDLHRQYAPSVSTRSAFCRLIHLPTIDTRSAGAELVAEAVDSLADPLPAAAARVSPTSEPTPVTLRFPESTPARSVRVTVRSHAVGTLQLANLVQIYRPMEET